MQGRKPNHETAEDLLHWHIGLYYRMLQDNVGIRNDPKAHEEQIMQIDAEYRKDLARRFPDWDTEDIRERFMVNIEFLTQFQAKKKQEEARSQERQALSEIAIKKIKDRHGR